MSISIVLSFDQHGLDSSVPPMPLFCQSLCTFAAQRHGSPAADSGKTTKPKNYFSGKVPLRTHAEGGQVQPVFGGILLMTT